MSSNIEQEILNDPSASFWLKEQIETTKHRDVVDAISDSETLTTVLKSRFTEDTHSIPKKVLHFEMGTSGNDLDAHTWELDITHHSEFEIRNYIRVLTIGLFPTAEHAQVSNRFLKVIGQNTHVLWGSYKIKTNNPCVDSFELPEPFVTEQ